MSDELNQYFRYKCFKGLEERGLSEKQEYIDRLNYEIDLVIQMGFPGYFLITADFIVAAKKHSVVGPSRGSCGGSLVCYCLRITELDPIIHGTYFERFINPGRFKRARPTDDIPRQNNTKNLSIQELCNIITSGG